MINDDDLPEGWSWAELKDIVLVPRTDIVDGPFGSDLKASEYVDEGIPIIRIQNVNRNAFVNKNLRFVSEQKAAELKRHHFQTGDIVITKLGDPLGKACLVPEGFGPGIIIADVVRVRINHPYVFKPYLVYAINSEPAIDQLLEHIKGTTRPRVNLGIIRSLKISVAPLAEQKRIAYLAGELIARVNAAKKRLEKASEILKRFRQSVLTAACSGRLTENWRSFHPDIESVSEYIDKVSLGALEKNSKKRKKNIEANKSYITAGDKSFEISSKWAWISLPDLGYLNRGRSRHRPRNAQHLYGGAYPFIQTGDIARSGGLINSHQQTYNENGLAQSRLWPKGTVCITIAANIAESGILSYPACFPDSIVGLIVKNDFCLPEYVEYFIRIAKSNLSQFAPATAQKNINIGILNDVEIPLPPFVEQKEIVLRVEALFKIADSIEKRISAATVRTEKLTQAILAKAFRGELVLTEAELARREGRSYETASDLLARIKGENKGEEKRGRAGINKYS